MLGNLIIADCFRQEIFAHAGLFKTTMWRFGREWNMIVNPDRAKFELSRDTHGTTDIARPDGGRQPIADIVAERNRFGLIIKGADGDNRAKDFALDNLGFLVSVGNNGRLEVIAAAEILGHTATRKHFRTISLRTIHEALNAFALDTGNQ